MLGGIIGAVLGIMAMASISSRPQQGGKGLAIAGIALGALNTFLVGPALLLALLLPAVSKVREAANRLQDANNLKQIGLALHSYDMDFTRLPPPAITSPDGKPLLSWRVAILPYIEQDALYKQFRLDEPWDSPHNIQLLDKMPKTYESPHRPPEQPGYTYYQAFVGPNTCFDPKEKLTIGRIAAEDGTANTIVVAEAAKGVPWTKPEDLPFDPEPGAPLPALGGPHSQGFNVLFGDGSVRYIMKTIDPETLRLLIDRRDGQAINMDKIK
jgi:prepilin-type processing-associated H-X9-DG protein